MKIQLKKREAFKVYGYVTETNAENNDRDIGLLWSQYESVLRKIPESRGQLYGVIWYTDESHKRYCYFLGFESSREYNDYDFIEIPSGNFAVAKVSKKMTEMEAWTEFFYNAIPANNLVPDEKHGLYFEFYNENGNCELWAPVIPKP